MEQIQTGMVNYLWKRNRGKKLTIWVWFIKSISNPTISNMTLVGPGSAPTTGTWLENL
jgi:hypothetical protein